MSALDTYSGQFKVLDGVQDVTTGHGVVYSVLSETGCDATIDPSTGVYTLSSVSSDNANATFRAVYGGAAPIDKNFSVAKSRAGSSGEAAKLIRLTASHQTFSYDTNGNPIAQTTSFLATKQGISTPTVWYVYSSDGVLVATGRSELEANGFVFASDELCSLDANAFNAAITTWNTNAFTIEAVADVRDRVSVTKVQDGVKGDAGPTLAIRPSQGSFTYVNGAATPASQTITFTAEVDGDPTAVNWSTVPAIKLLDNSSTFTITLAEMGANSNVVVNAIYNSTVLQSYALAKLADSGATVGMTPAEKETVDAITAGVAEIDVAVGEAQSEAATARQEAATASQEAAQIRTDLVPEINAAKQAGADASAEAAQIGTDLATEVARAKGAEGTLTTLVETAQGRADAAHTSISTETTQRTDADTALSQRIDAVKATSDGNTSAITTEQTVRTDADAALGQRIDTVVTQANTDRGDYTAKIAEEASARSDADSALASRSSKMESRFERVGTYAPPREDSYISTITGDPVTAVSQGRFDNTIPHYGPYVEFSQAAGFDAARQREVHALQRKTLTYHLRGRVWEVTNTPSKMMFYVEYLNADFQSVGAGVLGAIYTISDTAFHVHEYKGEIPFVEGAVWLRFCLLLNRDITNPYTTLATGAVTRVFEFTAEDVTTLKATEGAITALITTEETTRSSADAALATRATTLEARANGGGNLLSNTTLETTAGWTTGDAIGIGSNATFATNLAGPSYHPANEFTLGMRQYGHAGTSGYLLWQSERFAVRELSWLQWYVYANAHRALVGGTIYYYDGPGNYLGFSDLQAEVPANEGQKLSSYTQIGKPSVQVPAGAAQACFELRKYDTFAGWSDSYAWFIRPYVGEARQGQTEWNPFVHGSGRAARNETHARLLTEETTRSTADSALATRAFDLEGVVFNGPNQNSTLASRISTEETVRSTADAALANRSSVLEAAATSGGETLNPNPSFAMWPDPKGLPSGWHWWASATTVVREAQSLGKAGWAFDHTVPAATPSGILTRDTYITPGWYVMEADCWLKSGSWLGSGLTVGGHFHLDFHKEPDVNGVIGDTSYGGVRRFSKIVYVANGLGYLPFHLMTSWDGFTPIASIGAKQMSWSKALIRPATDAEIKAQKAFTTDIPNVVARISDEETARANADSALANRASQLEAQFRGEQASTIRSLIYDETTTRADADSALSSRISTTESQFAGTAGSALKSLIDDNRNNLIDTSWWKTGAAIPWLLNGGTENQIYTLPLVGSWGEIKAPDGASGDVFLCRSLDQSTAGGGWNAAPIAPLNPDKTYRFMVPIAPLDAVGARSCYWGTSGVCALNTTTIQDNPYFANAGNLPANRWYLFVGYIFPRNSTNKTHDGAGVWDMTTGERWAGGANYCFHPDGRQPIHRAYQYYATPYAYQAFGRPVVECVDGSERDIRAILDAKQSGVAANARITTEETTRANQDSALSSRIGTTEAKLNLDQDSSLYARIRAEETARANGDSAVANRTSILEAASLSSGNYMNANTSFSMWSNPASIPDGWSWWAASGGCVREARPASEGGGYIARLTTNGGEHGFYCPSISFGAGWYVMEADVVYNNGTTWVGSGLTLNGVYNFNFATEPDTNGVVGAAGVGLRRKFSKLVQLPEGTYNFHPMVQWASFGSGGAKDMTFRFAGVRPATDGEIKAQKVIDANVIARVTTTESAVSNLNGKTGAYWQVEAVAGGRARMRAYADNYGSSVDIAADTIYLGNQRSLAVENGKVTVTGDLHAGAGRIIFNNGAVMKVSGTGFGSQNQFIEWFGPTQADLANCSEANATSYLRVDGSAYFGGALSAGVLTASAQTGNTAADASVTVNTGSNGRPVVVVGSVNISGSRYNYIVGNNGQGGSVDNPAVTTNPWSATFDIRKNGVTVASHSVSGTTTTSTWYDFELNRTYYNTQTTGGGSKTWTDSSGSTAARDYTCVMTGRTGSLISGFTQRVSIASTEQ